MSLSVPKKNKLTSIIQGSWSVHIERERGSRPGYTIQFVDAIMYKTRFVQRSLTLSLAEAY